mmetsp:Transcript_81854/g.162536  ORF Transcript_81854/g.162536 Transcript_81854/m.162536 type:complete len:949 (+) Transcript_81854:65-2911(+)
MEVVNRLPRPADAAALAVLIDVQRILCSRCVDEEDCQHALEMLNKLAAQLDDGGYGYFPALLTLASLHGSGFEPGIPRNAARAASCLLQLLTQETICNDLSADILDEAAVQLCGVIRDGPVLLNKEQRAQLGDLAQGLAAGAVGNVASWAGFAGVEADRIIQEAAEDPGVRARRLEQEAARKAGRELEAERQREAGRVALLSADELRRQGNDLCRQGQLPGNSQARQQLSRAAALYDEATQVLSSCLQESACALEQTAELHKQRGLLLSNTTQVYLTLENWREALRLAEMSLEDDPRNIKAHYRRARAHVGLSEWEAAAQAVNEALQQLTATVNSGSSDMDTMRLDCWRLAEEVSKQLPKWQWSCAKPTVRQRTTEDDFEQRILGRWKYVGGSFEIRLEPWGALIFHEDNIKIDLMRKSKLRWRGELELISGMILHLSYEPGSDVLVTEFIPPDDVPVEQQWKGPRTFTAHRATEQHTVLPVQEPQQEPPKLSLTPTERSEAKEIAVPTALEASPLPAAALAEQEVKATEMDNVPTNVWLSGEEEMLHGRYELVPGQVLSNRPVYHRRRCDSTGSGVPLQSLFFWYRGGNWGVTTLLRSSPLAAPFLLRCADVAGRSRHPLDVRRPRWYASRGARAREEVEVSIHVSASATSLAGTPTTATTSLASSPQKTAVDPVANAAPEAVEIEGRVGQHAEVNGVYRASGSLWNGQSVYYKQAEDADGPTLCLFFGHGRWLLAEDVCSLPRAIARSPESTMHPVAVGTLEFLCDETVQGNMVSMQTRTYVMDRSVVLRVPSLHSAQGETGGTSVATLSASEESMAAEQAATENEAAETEATVVSLTSPCDLTAQESMPAKTPAAPALPDWVEDASAQVTGNQVHATVVARESVHIDLHSLNLDAGPRSLKMELCGHTMLELTLPALVDVQSCPTARWSEKKRTLKVCLTLAKLN